MDNREDGNNMLEMILAILQSQMGGYLSGKLMDKGIDAIRQNFNEEIMYSNLLSAVTRSLDKVLKKCGIQNWSKNDFAAAFRERFGTRVQMNQLVDRDVEFKTFVEEYIAKNASKRLPEGWIDIFHEKIIMELATDSNNVNYILLNLIQDRVQKEQEDAAEFDKLTELVKKDIDAHRNSDMYQDLEIINRVIYPFFCDKAVAGCSQVVIEIGYALTDIYEHISDYTRSVNIAQLLLKILDGSEVNKDKQYFHKKIGCAYSLGIAKPDSIREKKQLLEQAEEVFADIREQLNHWEPLSNAGKLFIEGLYYSDYAAVLTSKADVVFQETRHQDIDLLNRVLECHYKSLQNRDKLLDIITPSQHPEYDDAERRFTQTKSNIAGLCYRLGRYDDALRFHHDVLKYWIRKNETTRIHLTKSHILGAYIGKWEAGHNPTIDDVNIYLSYLVECEAYYGTNQDAQRLADIQEKRDKIERLIKKMKSQKTKKEKEDKPTDEEA